MLPTPESQLDASTSGESLLNDDAPSSDGRLPRGAMPRGNLSGTHGHQVAHDDQVGCESRDAAAPPWWRRAARPIMNFYVQRRQTPAVLVSLIVHLALILLLALVAIGPDLGIGTDFDFVAENANHEAQAQQPTPMLAGAASPPPPMHQSDFGESSAAAPQLAPALISAILQLEHAQERPTRVASAHSLEKILEASASNLNSEFKSTGVEGRRPELRQKIALERGGTLQSEEAVERALRWLAAHQLPNGGWSLVHDAGSCNGRCKNPGSQDRFDPAATGLALLAFLGAGYTHLEGEHRETVRKGIYFLYQIIEETRQGGSLMYQCERGMYNHGIAAFALCEAYQLTGDRDLERAAQLAIDFIGSAQNYRGGWGYLPKKPGDLTISGWQTMALKSGQAGNLHVPTQTILALDSFLDSQQQTDGIFFGYGAPGKSTTCTAIGHLLRLFRGMTHSDPKILQSADYFRKLGFSRADVYQNYYVSLFLFHAGGGFFEQWNPPMRDYLIRTQATDGHQAGSWYFENQWAKEGGRLYTTAMAAMTLEVYYRFSPLYQQADEPFEL